MEKKEKVAEKRMFTTYNIHEKIKKNIVTLPGIDWRIQQYNYLYIVHKIISHINLHKDDTPGCKVNVEYLSKLFGKPNPQTADILRNLQKWDIIYQSVPATKKSSARYLLTADHVDDRLFMFTVSSKDVAFIDKIIKFKQKELEDKFILKSLNLIKSSLSVNSHGYNYLNNKYNLFNSNGNGLLLDGYADLESAFLLRKTGFLDQDLNQKVNGGYGIERRDIPLFLILIKEFTCKRPPDRNGNKSRVYNNLTNLPREHRQYIHFCGQPLLMTDISNSQILLTVPMIEKYYKIHSGKGAAGMPDDIIKFKEWAESGQFYENFSKLIYYQNGMTTQQRKDLKIMIFRVLWFGKNTRFKNINRVKSLFIKNFPNVYKIMSALKKEDYKQFSIELQRFEASIIVDKVAKKMLVKQPVLTLHDAIICADTATLHDAETRITDALKKYNLHPKFKREDGNACTIPEVINQSVDSEIQLILPKRITSVTNRVIKPLEKKVYPVDEEFLAESRAFYASRTKEQIVFDYEKYEGKPFPQKYRKWLESR